MEAESRERGMLEGMAARIMGPTSRRSFLRRGGAALAVAGTLSACDDIFGGDDDDDDDAVTLDFSTDFGILNYAYALEQLEAAFYTAVVANAGFNAAFSDRERRVLTDLRDHEIAHREFFRTAIPALGGQAIPALTADFSAVDLGNRTSVLATARTFEDLGVAAYNGAGPLFSNSATGRTLLTVAGKIVSVEARHAAAIRDLISPKAGGANGFAPNAVDEGMTPQEVLAQADPFLVERVRVRNVSTIG